MRNRGIFYGLVASLLWHRLQAPIWLIALILLVLYAGLGGYRYLIVCARTCRRDFVGLYRYLCVVFGVRRFQRKNYSVPQVFEETVAQHPDKVAFVFEDKQWTFKQINELTNQIAHVFEDAGFKPGDSVALVLENRPEYVAIWLGLAKAGIVTALINHNLKEKPLIHSLKISSCKAIIYGAELTQNVENVREQLDTSVVYYAFSHGTKPIPSWSTSLDAAVAEASMAPLAGPQRSNYNDKLLYIYTSGTTGLPKAAVIRHSRYAFLVCGAFYVNGIRADDVVYVPLPLHHSAGGVVGSGQSLFFGCTVVLRSKFSASAFWTDTIQHQCTVAQYIGETCRYLLATAPRPEERAHKIRLMYGNGLRPQIWAEFVKRFNIAQISEFYGATEGNANIINFDGRVGAIGFVSMIAPSFYPVALIKVSEDTAEPIRGPDGLCIRCKPGEPGMFIGMIVKDHPIRDFHGYVDSNATKKKVACDVFRRGDAAFLSGDILVMDEDGYLFFKDRTGDTFRWRGENVSTTEVEAVISNVACLKDCVVYGVEVPGSEGRAGMAAILDPNRVIDLVALAQGMAKVLPTYSRPLFIRIVSSIDLTGTYKLRKVDYQKEGFDIARVQDAIYMMDSASQLYVPYTHELQEKLISGKIRV